MKRIVAVSHACVRAINRSIYRKLGELGWDVHLVTAAELPPPDGPLRAEADVPGDPPLHRLKLSSTNPRIYRFHGLDELLDQQQPDVVFLEVDPVSRLAIEVGQWARRNGNVPVTCLSCENLPQSMTAILSREGLRGLPSGLAKKWLGFRARPLVTHVFAINNDGLGLFRRLGYRSVSKIALGFDRRFFHPNEEARRRLRRELKCGDLVFAYFGRFVPEKGVHLLLESLAKLRELPWQLMLDQFEGSDAYSKRLENQIERAGLEERIIKVHAAHGEVADYMNAADVVVLPSQSTRKWKEQYGRVAPEAMACGRLVIAAESGALPELLAGFGLMFPEGDVDALAQLLKQVIEDRSLLDRGNEAAEHAANSLSIDRQAVQMNEVFSRLCG